MILPLEEQFGSREGGKTPAEENDQGRKLALALREKKNYRTQVRSLSTLHTDCFWPKKMGKSAEGSRRVVISHTQWQLPLKAHKVVLGSTSLMFHRRNRHPHPLIYVWGLNFKPSHTNTKKKKRFFNSFIYSK